MKSLKITVLALFMLMVNLACAQKATKTAEEIATEKTEQLTNQLGLSAEQKKEAYQAYLQNAQQMEATRAKYQKNVTSIREADQQNNKILSESINKILTEKQKAEYRKKDQSKNVKQKQTDTKNSTSDTK
jgi:hypothetical protein